MLTSKHSISAAKPLLERYFWPLLALIWLAATGLDRLWLHLDQRLPAWDQADYLNSALDHGQALGLLAGGSWQGWQPLLDLSPKIPPLASLLNGTVLAIAGDHPDQAAWALSLWFGMLLLVVALWGRELMGAGLGLGAALLCCLMPLLAELRVDYVLEIPVCASCTWALWLLGRWLKGGKWLQALAAAAAIAAALLIKQSALLVLLLPVLWVSLSALWLGGPRRLQLLAAMALVLALLLPWLQHNLVTTLGGTQRATLESAAREGDPNASSLAGWLWYPKRLPALVGELPLFGGIAGLLIATWRRPVAKKWFWLSGCLAAGALLTVLSPNKDPRYLAPLLPLLALVLARGWLALPLPLLGLGLVVAGGLTASTRARAIERQGTPPEPLEAIVRYLQAQKPMAARTLIVVPSTGSLNQHNVSYY
ncbi:MAG: glycosyltransferase family 39 protein, partial [Synechococcus lacustris]|nr:glycosyltransferase family 39 protein [Synechococcus lacustris]